MKKKIYAVRRGRETGIYREWPETQRQVKGFKGAEYRGFAYMTEREDEDETVELSLACAQAAAREYLRGASVAAEPAKDVGESQLSERYDEQAALEKELASVTDQKILKESGLERDSHGNSPWIAAMMKYFTQKSNEVLIDVEQYVGRYSCTSLYLLLLYMVLDETKILKTAPHRRTNSFSDYLVPDDLEPDDLPFGDDPRSVLDVWHDTESYVQLKKRFEEYGMEAVDVSEVRNRNALRAKKIWSSYGLLSKTTQSYMSMQRFMKEGGHTVMGLYLELVENPVYRQELLEVSGPFQNPDLEKGLSKKEEPEICLSVQDMVSQASAINIALTEKVVGQDDVIDKIEKSYFHSEKAVNAGAKKKGPRHVYLFAGPSGVGKTFSAEIIAETMGVDYKRFDMSAYSHYSNAQDLVGHSQTWKDARPGVLTEFVRDHPRCVLLFDEIEKACREVIVLFLQILDAGTCHDKYYEEDVDFRETIVIFTTNAGKQLYQDVRNENLTLLPDSVIIDALKKDLRPDSKEPFFPPEIISRMSSHTIIMFNHLRAGAILKIIKADLAAQMNALKDTHGYAVTIEQDHFAATALYSMGSGMDARNATALAGKFIDRGLYELLTLAEEKVGLSRRGGMRKIALEHDFTGMTDEIRQFYLGERDCVIAVFGQIEEIHDERLANNNVRVRISADPEEFLQILRKENVILTVVDYGYGRKEYGSNLGIADIQSEGSRIFSDIRAEYGDIPVYVMHGNAYSQRERQELCRLGAYGFIGRENVRTELYEAYAGICCQKVMETLALRHQRLAFDIRKELDEKQCVGKLVFCNFRLEAAVEAEDRERLLSVNMMPNKHWDDVYASASVKDELKYFVDFLKKPKEYIRKGAGIPKGVLLYGPPGTGKTSLAKVVATESGVSFLEVGADQLVIGGPKEVHQVFRIARKYAPAVLFIDEADAIGKVRTMSSEGRNITLNALLEEMDGFKKVDDKPVFVMAATNAPKEGLDPAFVRRFDLSVIIGLPDAHGRRWKFDCLLRQHASVFEVTSEEIDSIVSRSEGISFAKIENIIAAALREAIRSGRRVDDILLDEVFEKSNHGEARETSSLEKVKHTAYHEAGHALAYLCHGKIPDYISIVARGGHGGYVSGVCSECLTKKSLLESICEKLAGRAAELVCGYGLTPGAASDLQQATAYAKAMVCSYGMYKEEVGLAVQSKVELLYNEKAKNLINQILSEQLQEAMTIMNNNRQMLDRLANAVMNSPKKYLTQKEIKAVYNGSDES